MAIHTNEETPKTETQSQGEQMLNATQNVQNQGQFNNQGFGHTASYGGEDYSKSIGFGQSGLNIMSSNQGSEYTNQIAKAIADAYKSNQTIVGKPRVHILDKEVISTNGNVKLAYSCIVVSLAKDSDINYFTIMLENTGRAPMTAQDVMTEVNIAAKANAQRPTIYTTDDAIDSVLHQVIQSVLQAEYGANYTFRSVEGLVFRNEVQDPQNLYPQLAAIAYNACVVESELETGERKDLNIENANNRSHGKSLRIDSFMSKAIANNEVGSPVRSDFKIELNMVDNTQNITSLNLQNSMVPLTKTAGFVDAIPEMVQVGAVNNAPVNGIRLRPHIVLTDFNLKVPTVGYSMLAITSALVMTNKNMWVSSLLPKDSKNVGALNLLTNIEGNQNSIGDRIDFSKKSYKPEDVYQGIQTMFSLDPVVSVDVDSFGPQTFFTSILSTIAQPSASVEKQAASQHLIDTLVWLTSGRFPRDFNPAEIFVGSGVVLPSGVWHDKNGVRDLREIDLAFLANHVDDINVLNRWVLSGTPMSVSNIDPYLTRVDIISKLIPDAVIRGKFVRVTFTSKFIATLSAAAMGSGLSIRYEPEIKFVEDNNLAVMGSYLAGAGIQGATGFAREFVQVGPSYNTQYTTAGQYRFQ